MRPWRAKNRATPLSSFPQAIAAKQSNSTDGRNGFVSVAKAPSILRSMSAKAASSPVNRITASSRIAAMPV
jgi:hypothetical protein